FVKSPPENVISPVRFITQLGADVIVERRGKRRPNRGQARIEIGLLRGGLENVALQAAVVTTHHLLLLPEQLLGETLGLDAQIAVVDIAYFEAGKPGKLSDGFP